MAHSTDGERASTRDRATASPPISNVGASPLLARTRTPLPLPATATPVESTLPKTSRSALVRVPVEAMADLSASVRLDFAARITSEPLSVSPALREYVEEPDRFSHLAPEASVERFADSRICILQAPTWASVSGVHVGADEVEALLEEVRSRVHGKGAPIWWIGPSAEPSDVYERLAALKARLDPENLFRLNANIELAE